jgi:putative transcriptional regulator
MKKASKDKGIGNDLITSLNEALSHARGEGVGARATKFNVPAVAVRNIRQKVGLTQDDFASLLGVSVSGLRKWEQGQRRPHGAALTLLKVMDREPQAVVRAIAKTA